jgi:hypothetical protein
MAASAQKKDARRAAATAAEAEAIRKADFDAKRNAAAGMETGMKKGGKVKKMAKGGSVSASRRGDGCATKGKTKGRFV